MSYSGDSAPLASSADAPILDLDSIRSDFPILRQKVYDHELVYLDNGASAQKPEIVIRAISDYYSTDHSNIHRGVHTLSQRATNLYESARERVRDFINARSTNEIIYVRGTTEGINLVASSYGLNHIGSGDEVLITEMEHHSNIVPWQLLCERSGAALKVAPIDDNGDIVELADTVDGVADNLREALKQLHQTDPAFRDVGQAESVLRIVFENVLPAYRVFHADLLEHQAIGAIERPFFDVFVYCCHTLIIVEFLQVAELLQLNHELFSYIMHEQFHQVFFIFTQISLYSALNSAPSCYLGIEPLLRLPLHQQL